MKCFVFLIVLAVFNGCICKINKHKGIHKDTSIKYLTKQTDITIPIMMHLDKALTKIISPDKKMRIREKFKLLAKDILKDVEDYFSRPNLQQKIKFELLDVKIIKNTTEKVRMNENVSKYLRSYCQWQGQKKTAKQMWFYSVLFTGLDLFYLDNEGAEVRSSTGRGYMRGMCSNKNSCTLLEWHPENIAYILTHEIAHSLGISHDGPPHNECRGQRYIMDAKYNPRNPAKIWSTCNRRELNQYLKSDRSWCLKKDPNAVNINK
ncbi:A disintegrin and metalloproteinase with thrombospondin motifs adt-2-like [Trichoplusia ni]|uniref:A disintegrin and metalloproteinase with thrombospondin motifs adt-2-like n=1 Tax=Trichoplusia ni TaxID=7111 RepID=A0A7E5WGJ1_TRINI|nr:A disintegrin and metalloproteinase with thrombospondin motifs adt-2-like [Trichoplusia ni]